MTQFDQDLCQGALRKAQALGGQVVYMDTLDRSVKVVSAMDATSFKFKGTECWIKFKDVKLADFRLTLPISARVV